MALFNLSRSRFLSPCEELTGDTDYDVKLKLSDEAREQKRGQADTLRSKERGQHALILRTISSVRITHLGVLSIWARDTYVDSLGKKDEETLIGRLSHYDTHVTCRTRCRL
jgi:hypothetical protein